MDSSRKYKSSTYGQGKFCSLKAMLQLYIHMYMCTKSRSKMQVGWLVGWLVGFALATSQKFENHSLRLYLCIHSYGET